MVNIPSKNLNEGASFTQTVFQAVKVARPIHWVKNLALFAALIFSGNLFVEELSASVILAFISFGLATSSTYIFNDLKDAEQDALHPIKKYRPIAAKKLAPIVALTEMFALILASLFIASQLNTLFLLAVIAYLVIQILYSIVLKNLPVIDIIIIATGFIIRVYAGAFVINAHLSVWFLLCVVSVALFLAAGKRRAELNVLGSAATLTRKSMNQYKRELLNSYVTMFGNAAWMSWALFTFFESPKVSVPLWIFLAELSLATAVNKLLMVTIPIVIFGIMRYQALIFEGRSEAPEKLLLTDKPLVASVGLWTLTVVWVLYGGISI